MLFMHGVIETPTYRSDAKAAGLSEEEQAEIAFKVAQAPLAGALIPGTGGLESDASRPQTAARARVVAIG